MRATIDNDSPAAAKAADVDEDEHHAVQGEPLTRIDIPVLTSRRRWWLLICRAFRGIRIPFVLLLLSLPIGLWGVVLAQSLRPDWLHGLIPAFRLSVPVYLTAAVLIVAAGGRWRTARDFCLAVVLIVVGSQVAMALA